MKNAICNILTLAFFVHLDAVAWPVVSAADVTTALAARPSDAAALMMADLLSDQAEKLNNGMAFKSAIELCNKATQITPDYGRPRLVRAQSYIGMGKGTLALADLNTLCEAGPFMWLAMTDRARYFVSIKRYDEALKDLDKLAKFYHTDAVFTLRARSHIALNQLHQAASDYTEALKLKPHSYDLLYERAELYNKLHQPEKAISDLNQMIDQSGSKKGEYVDSKVYVTRAKAYEMLGNKTQATQDHKRADEAAKNDFDEAPFRPR